LVKVEVTFSLTNEYSRGDEKAPWGEASHERGRSEIEKVPPPLLNLRKKGGNLHRG